MKARVVKLFGFSLCTCIVLFGFEVLRTTTVRRLNLTKMHSQFSNSNSIRISSDDRSSQTVNVTTELTDNYPRLVLILSYQRCGSSFFGGLFDMAPRSLYTYEPLDSLYTALYGAQEGWNVPSDIRNYKNGTVRIIPESELREVSEFLANLLQCNFSALPLEFFLHKFWREFANYERSTRVYRECISKEGLYQARSRCYDRIKAMCPVRFTANTLTCHDYLSQVKSNHSFNEGGGILKSRERFLNYSSCMEGYRPKVDRCIQKLNDICERSLVRSTKTVRATMASVEYLIERIPNVKVIHLIRDPRAVALSRKYFDPSTHGLYSKGDLIKEARLYCQNLAQDIVKRRELEAKYPRSLMEVVYEKFVKNPLKYTQDIYSFMKVTLSEHVIKWIEKNTKESTNSTTIAQKWQHKLSYVTAKQISTICRDVFELTDCVWDC